jgi:hypothetical protein
MARPVTVGPLRLWAKHGAHGDVIVCEHGGARVEYPRSNRTARSVAAWQAYRDRDDAAASSYPYLPTR